MSNLTIHQEMTKEQLALIKATVAKGASDNEMQLFLYRCKTMGLDPLKPGQVHFVKYGTNPGTMIIGIDGFRAMAASTGLHSGTKRGIIRDDKGACLGAWCEVYRKDWTQCAREEVSLSEYTTGKAMWAKMPETMIKKVAEVAALRMAFPDQLAGAYTSEEMDQAKPLEIKQTAVVETIEEPKKVKNYAEGIKSSLPESKDVGGDYVIKFGKYTGQMIKDIGFDDLNDYAEYIESQAEANKKPIDPNSLPGQFLSNLKLYFQNSPQPVTPAEEQIKQIPF